MALDFPQSRLTIDTSRETSLKRGKSLTRSLSTAFKRPNKPRPTSPSSQNLALPSAPRLPYEHRPQTAGTSHTPSPAFELVIDKGEGKDPDVTEGAVGLKENANHNEATGLQVKKKRSIRQFSLRQSRQKSWTTGDDATGARTATAANAQAQAPDTNFEQTKQNKIKPKKSLRITSSGRTSSKDRSASAAIPIPTSSPSMPTISRPATYGASLPSPTPSSDSRRRGNSSPRSTHSRIPPDPFDLPQSPRLPWHTSSNYTDPRSSYRSAITATSSRTTTTRNSILTKETALTDVTTDSPSHADAKDGSKAIEEEGEGMTVDEAIDMYAAGFTDDPIEPDDARNTSVSEEEQRRSTKIAEAIGADMGSSDVMSSAPSSARPSTSGSLNTRSFRSPSFGQSTLSHGTSFPYGASRDQYGFLKYNHYITRTIYDAWFADYYPSQVRRGHKWMAYMKEHKLSTDDPTVFPPHSAKTQRYIRKGIPPAWRGSAWFHYANGDEFLDRHPQLYNNLVHLTDRKLSLSDKEAIERDLHRTFPDNVRFKPEPGTSSTEETELLVSLRRVLQSFALQHPQIGYCQSLNFIAALLLLFMPEEKAFWMLHIITTVYLPATHEVSLEGANVDLWVLAVALKKSIPGVWAKVDGKGLLEDGKKAKLPPISLCATSWFMSLYIGTLPVETVLRVWDVLFYEGSRTLFRTALAIFKIGEPKIKSIGDSMELFQVVQSLPRGMVDASTFLDVVCKKGQVAGDWVERMRGERRMYFAKQRAKSAGLPALAATVDHTALDTTVDKKHVDRKKSVWRKKKTEEAS